MYSKMSGGKNIPGRCHFSLLMAEENGKWKEELIGILFMKINENWRKGRWKVKGLHEREIERKMKENEEIRGLNDKKIF